MDWNDSRGEHRAPAGFIQIALALLQQTWIDSLHFRLLINLLRATPFQNHTRNSSHVIPNRKIGNNRPAGECKNVIPFQHAAAVIREDLTHAHARMPVIDMNVDGHLFQR